jgi:hypothetical protein
MPVEDGRLVYSTIPVGMSPGSVVVEALCSKQEGRGFETR